MDALLTDLNDYGIVNAGGLYGSDEIAAINGALDPHFAALSNQPRSYAYSRDLDALGILNSVLSKRVIRSFYEIIPDPVLYHLHCYEIAGAQAKSHIFGNELRGWHRDPDSSYSAERPSHISLFVHLSDVGEEDGAFEFMPHTATRKFANKVPACTMIGETGKSYYWNRHFFHRASPNRGTRRRRMLKLSIQGSRWASSSLSLEHMAPVVARMKTADEHLAGLFGHRTNSTPQGFDAASGVKYSRIPTNTEVDIGVGPLLRSKLKTLLKGEPQPEKVAYEA